MCHAICNNVTDMAMCHSVTVPPYQYFHLQHQLLQIFHCLKIFFITIHLNIFRRMFPTVRVSFRNIPDGGKFLVLLDIVPCDNKRYR